MKDSVGEVEMACEGCERTITVPSPRNALSRYGHGQICGNCGTREALEGDFIGERAGV